MGWTKRQFVEAAYEEIGYASYTYDLEPERLEAAMRRLDALMATWNSWGIRLGYPIPDSPENSNLDTETDVPDRANEAIYLNLALRLAPTVGKQVSPDTRMSAHNAYEAVLIHYTRPPEMTYPDTLPKGAGNKSWGYGDTYFTGPGSTIGAGEDSTIDFE